MDRTLVVLAGIAYLIWRRNQPQSSGNLDIYASIYSRFINRKNQGIGKRGNWQFIYTNEIYFLVSPYVSTVRSGVQDPLLFQIYEQAEKVIQLGEQNKAFSPVLSAWVAMYLKTVPANVLDDVKMYETKLFKVSQSTWNGKPLV